jgi:predicted transposase YbfD/YdcC
VITLCAVISGAEGGEDIAEYGRAQQEWLSQFLSLPNGIPSEDTFGRVFTRIDPEQFQDCFLNWVNTIGQRLEAEVIGIDGKTLRHSGDSSQGQAPIHLVSAWASASNLVLGQRQVDAKSNEITAIAELLKVLALNGCIVTIDAMGCQTNIADVMIGQGADYVLALKGNQGSLDEDVQWLFEQATAVDFVGINRDFAQTITKGHGRIETRRCWTRSDLSYLS